jgi:hypothetical protein
VKRSDLQYWRADGNRRLRRQRRRGTLTRVTLALLVGGTVGAGLVYLGREVLTRPSCRVQRIEVEGTRHLDPDRVRALAGDFLGEPLFFLDLEAVRRAVEDDPWVARASVGRVWPCVVRVTVTERTPAALALVESRPWLIAGDGTRLAPHGPEGPVLDLPVLTGLTPDVSGEGRLLRGTAALGAIAAEAPALAERISSVDLSSPARTVVYLSGASFPLWLDPVEPGRNLRSWEALRQVMNRDVAPARVDLRWRGRIAVLPRRMEN